MHQPAKSGRARRRPQPRQGAHLPALDHVTARGADRAAAAGEVPVQPAPQPARPADQPDVRVAAPGHQPGGCQQAERAQPACHEHAGAQRARQAGPRPVRRGCAQHLRAQQRAARHRGACACRSAPTSIGSPSGVPARARVSARLARRALRLTTQS